MRLVAHPVPPRSRAEAEVRRFLATGKESVLVTAAPPNFARTVRTWLKRNDRSDIGVAVRKDKTYLFLIDKEDAA